MINEVKANDINMKPFKVKKTLNKDFFDDKSKMNSQIRMRLLDIADDFIKTLEVKWVKPLDIVVTGSIVNYNWSEFSDVDVHVIYEYKKIYKKHEFVQDYFMSKRDNWNKSHEHLTIKDFPVEISVEDINSPLQSSGIYSLEKNAWVKEPKKMDDSSMDIKDIQKYCAKQMTKMDELFNEMDNEKDRKKLEILANKLSELLDAVHKKRKSGLQTKAKELSNGNIMWKVIKHMGYADKVHQYLDKVYDRRNTIDEHKHIVYISEAQYKNAKNLFAPIVKFIDVVNQTLYLKDIYKLNPNSQDDKRIVCAAFAEAGFKNIGTLKGTKDDWIKRMTVSNENRRVITNAIKRLKDERNEKDDMTYQKLQDEIRLNSAIPEEDNMLAANMETFINTPNTNEFWE